MSQELDGERPPVVLDWPDHLDALEEWLRRARDLLEAGGELPPLASTPEGPLPEELRLRAGVALDALHRLEQAGARRARELQRGRAYEQN
ncbi:MAG: hypothetical protein JWO60_893 [Frankiales bacterium]|jgi:hypothetical protein|nr:hypothetical protein [Frankiales bacterium]